LHHATEQVLEHSPTSLRSNCMVLSGILASSKIGYLQLSTSKTNKSVRPSLWI